MSANQKARATKKEESELETLRNKVAALEKEKQVLVTLVNNCVIEAQNSVEHMKDKINASLKPS